MGRTQLNKVDRLGCWQGKMNEGTKNYEDINIIEIEDRCWSAREKRRMVIKDVIEKFVENRKML